MLRGRVVHIKRPYTAGGTEISRRNQEIHPKIFAGRSRICIGEQIIAHDMMRVMLKFGRSGEHDHCRGGLDERGNHRDPTYMCLVPTIITMMIDSA